MMVMLGMFHVIDGLVALFQDESSWSGRSGLTVHVDYTAWGWVHLIGGIVIVAAGIGLFAGKIWARSVGGRGRHDERGREPRLPGGVPDLVRRS